MVDKCRRAKKYLFIWDRIGTAQNYFKSMEVYHEYQKPGERSNLTSDEVNAKFRKGLFKAVTDSSSQSCFCINLGNQQVEPNETRDEKFPATSMFNYRHWRENYMTELEKYGMFEENKVNKSKFKMD